MKRLLLLCAIVLSLGMAGTAVAAPFGNFNELDSFGNNLSTLFPDAFFIDGFRNSVLEQTFYYQVIFAADHVVNYRQAQIIHTDDTVFYFADVASLWGKTSVQDDIGMTNLADWQYSYKLYNVAVDVQLYVGEDMAYKPDASLDSAVIIEGGSYLAAFSFAHSTTIDFVVLFAPNPIGFKSTPAPAALLLLGTGLAGIVATRKRIKN